MTASTGHSWTRSYEPHRNLITAVQNTYGPAIISRFDYANDEIGRRVSRADSGIAFDNPAFDVYAYNTRSEVIGAQRYHGTDVSDTSKVYGGRGFGYNYDPIGNRTSASETIGGETLVKSYTANALNQYTSIANPDAVGLRGSATNTATVTVNGSAASRDSIASDTVPWHYALPADNANGGAYTFAEIMAAVNPPGTNTPDIVSTASGNVYAPPRNETPTYDLDGNLLSDGRFNYTWNGENRLIKAEEQVCPTNRTLRKVEYAYDPQGRMVWKVVSRRGAEAQSWEVAESRSFLYDGWNLVQELTQPGTHDLTTFYTWGLDLSGFLQGAGGVGGLLAVAKDGDSFLPAFDGNGNVMEYVSEDGTVIAHYEYDSFGETSVKFGPLADAFSFRFSTKYWENEAKLYYYGYRFYQPDVGRWLNRDPIGEQGGINVLAFILNHPIGRHDRLGLDGNPVCGLNGPVGSGWGPYWPNPWEPYTPPSPPPPGPGPWDQFNPFGCRGRTGSKDYTRWFEQRFPNSVAGAKDLLATRIIKKACAGMPNRPSTVPDLIGGEDDVDIGNDMKRFGDDPQTFWERNARIGDFQFKAENVQVVWTDNCCFTFTALVYIVEHTGADNPLAPGGECCMEDPLWFTFMFVTRDVRMAEWTISGSACCGFGNE